MDIALQHVKKSFGEKEVLKDVSVVFKGGKINALLGENGAGKTTLADIISAEKGVSKVNQNPLLSLRSSVKENLFAGLKISRKEFKICAEKLKNEWCPALDLSKKVFDIPPSQRFFTSLLSCLLKNPEVLILDEPCRTLEWQDRRILYANIRKLAQSGMNVIIITHSPEEAQFYTDTITVLENGRVSAFYENSRNFNSAAHKFMKSGDKNHIELKKSAELSAAQDFLLEFKNLSCRPKFRPRLFIKDLKIEKAKVNLISGTQENGLSTLENILCGMEKSRVTGKLFWKTEKNSALTEKSMNLRFSHLNAKKVRNLFGKNKTALISSDKIFRSSNPALTVEDVLTVSLPAGFFFPETKSAAEKMIKNAKVNAKTSDKAKTLSGGMLQKLILERELSSNPKLLILCEPLQGLDFASAREMCGRIKSLSRTGKTVVVLSGTEYPESFADRIHNL